MKWETDYDRYTYVSDARREQIINNKQRAASATGTPFSLEVDNVYWPQYCPALGIPLDYGLKGKTNRSDYSPSFDKLDPAKGYTPENTRIISWRANRIKNDGCFEELRKIADWLENELAQQEQF